MPAYKEALKRKMESYKNNPEKGFEYFSDEFKRLRDNHHAKEYVDILIRIRSEYYKNLMQNEKDDKKKGKIRKLSKKYALEFGD